MKPVVRAYSRKIGQGCDFSQKGQKSSKKGQNIGKLGQNIGKNFYHFASEY